MAFDPEMIITINFHNNSSSEFMNNITNICKGRYFLVMGALRNALVIIFLEREDDAVLIKLFID